MICQCSVDTKVYVEKATQTDLSADPSTLLLSSRRGLTGLAGASVTDSVTSAKNPTVPNDEKSAYTYLKTEILDGTIQPSPLSSSSLTARQRYAQLPFNRPADFRQSTKRVFSLPQENVNDATSDEVTSRRVVSMPERIKPSSPNLSANFSADVSSSSSDFDASGFNRALKIRDHAYPHSDLPSTPSPPSSPESIMIISNDAQVPRTFLRPNPFLSVSLIIVHISQSGWISWANSPPRPIPALHGPLSLPYARCPSGAEGTIIEGEDLSNMIWGLSLDDTHSKAHGNSDPYQKSRNQKVSPRLHKSPPPSNSALLDYGPIDLSQLAITCQSDIAQSPLEAQCKNVRYIDSVPCVKSGHIEAQEVVDDRGGNWHKGLGFDWQDAIELPPPNFRIVRQNREHSNLKPSALPFVPSILPAPRTLPRIVLEPRISDYIQNPHSPVVHDETRKITASYLPTPPNSSSPLWSPYISIQSELESASPSISLYQLPEDRQVLLSRLFTPSAAKDGLGELNCWVTNRHEPAVDALQTPVGNVSTSPTHTLPQRNRDRMLNPHANEAKTLPSSDGNAYHTSKKPPRLVLELPAQGAGKNQQSSRNQSIFISPEKRFRGISYQPRSIPLARLIQRRLSSVAEEDLNTLLEDKNYSQPFYEHVCTSQDSEPTQQMRQPCHEPTASSARTTPSPVASILEPQTLTGPDSDATMTANEMMFSSNYDRTARVKLPGVSDGPLNHKTTLPKATKSQEKENDQVVIGPGIKKKARNRKRSRSSPLAQAMK
ncbi:hypothetical protein AX17_001398 [Amanita inopinata Kibby_2008]|nr:hypothetical protein AX17_001398 [Amanita inopinata Kibby_2008]